MALKHCTDELVDGTGLETSGDPVFMAADPVDVLGWRNQLVQR